MRTLTFENSVHADGTEIGENDFTDAYFLSLLFKEFVLSKHSGNWFVMSSANLSDGKHHVTEFAPRTECNMSLMKHPYVVTHRYTALQATEEPDRFSTNQCLSVLFLYGNIKIRIFGGWKEARKDYP